MRKIEKYKNTLKLTILMVVSFLIRLLPHRTGTVASLDSYLHRDIAMRIVELGTSFYPTDLYSLLGLDAYGYPLGFHTILAALFKTFSQDAVIWVFPAILGCLTVLAVYFLTKEVFNDANVAIVSALLFSMAPSFVQRSSIIIPENMGILLFVTVLLFSIRFVKADETRGKIKNLIPIMIFGTGYLLTHRGWIFLAMTLALLVFVYYMLDFFLKKPKYIVLLGALAVPFFIPTFRHLFSEAMSRIPQSPVTAVGFVKWGDIFQIVFGIYGLKLLFFEKDKIKRFFVAWGIAFLILGAYSFRFRDPYSVIPLSILAGYVIIEKLIPYIKEIVPSLNLPILQPKQIVVLAIFAIILIPTLQGTYAANNYLTPPTITEIDAMDWINENADEDAIFLTWKEEGYTIIGETHRKDIITWEKVFLGFYGDAPTVKEANETYYDVVGMFVSPNKEYAYDLIETYDVDYVYYDKRMWSLGLMLGGLSEYLPYDTHFDPMFANGYSMICEYVEDPPMPELSTPLKTNLAIDEYLDQFWNGYSYCDFDDGYKGDHVENARIAYLYHLMYNETGNEIYKQRYEWLIEWLLYKQLPDGGWCEVKPPDEYSLTTALTLMPLLMIEDENPLRIEAIENAKEFLLDRINDDYILVSPTQDEYSRMVNSLTGWVFSELGLDDEASVLISRVLGEQKDSGAWSGSTAENIVIMRGLALYAMDGGNIGTSIDSAAQWLISKQDETGSFKDHDPDKYNIEQYSSSMLIYDVAGISDLVSLELEFIEGYYLPMDEKTPLGNFLDLFMDLSYVYGADEAISIASRLVEEQ